MSKRRKYQDVSELSLPDAVNVIKQTETNDHARNSGRTKNSGQTSDFSQQPLRIILLPFRIAGSIIVGIIILTILLLLLAWGTFIESEYGAEVSRFALYGSSWFALLLGIFGLNILCAMLSRFPWRLHHFPFLTAHCGIIVLLFGCYLTWVGGDIAQITLPEGTVGTKAMKTNQQHLTVQTISSSGTKQDAVDIPFEPGPFNWEDFNRVHWTQQNRKYRATLGLAMQLGHRDVGELRGSKEVKIEVLDYLACSATEPVSPLELSILWKKPVQITTDFGDVKESTRNWERVRLEIKPQGHFGRMEIRGVQSEMTLKERITYRIAVSMLEVEAFRTGLPERNFNASAARNRGQIVLTYNNKNSSIDVDRLLRETEGNKRFRLDGTHFEIGNVQFNPRGLLLRLTLFSGNGEMEQMTLFPDNPEMNVQAQTFGVFGSYWLNPETFPQNTDYADHPILQRLTKLRLDMIQGTDKKLYYRLWDGQKISANGVVPDRTTGKKTQFTVAPQTPEEADIVVERFAPQDLPGLRIISLPVGKGQNAVQRVKLRVTFDGNADTFWLRAVEKSVVPLPPERDQIRYVHGNNRSVRIQWNYDTVDLGFGIFLKQFEMRTEPGTRMSSHYSSLVDFVEMRNPSQTGFSRSPDDFRTIGSGQDVLISMNRPVVFRGSGRGYRIYQSSYSGPYHPDDPWFFELYDGKIFSWEKMPRESLYMSTLSINNDPGRSLKYLGCFFVIFGTVWFFYRRSEN